MAGSAEPRPSAARGKRVVGDPGGEVVDDRAGGRRGAASRPRLGRAPGGRRGGPATGPAGSQRGGLIPRPHEGRLAGRAAQRQQGLAPQLLQAGDGPAEGARGRATSRSTIPRARSGAPSASASSAAARHNTRSASVSIELAGSSVLSRSARRRRGRPAPRDRGQPAGGASRPVQRVGLPRRGRRPLKQCRARGRASRSA